MYIDAAGGASYRQRGTRLIVLTRSRCGAAQQLALESAARIPCDIVTALGSSLPYLASNGASALEIDCRASGFNTHLASSRATSVLNAVLGKSNSEPALVILMASGPENTLATSPRMSLV